ncbi:prolyl oligopeptidase family serine peptidase [Corynebacterium sp. CNCTC7651]|uniref:alpha/beta hydrolase family esterase n=1 Tax=Corynebacterium sp. CNCTC7651 TaxID=2815361 RepID=UPI001F27DA83|nr:PHB depolymerase family esterase [Corynebacterium sp. CNCTC7651]UIZ93112.1 prolyl oligopeptidase family serine peptidase [Corynebacterium sp. CNCTC7651]
MTTFLLLTLPLTSCADVSEPVVPSPTTVVVEDGEDQVSVDKLSPATVEERTLDVGGVRRGYILSLPEGAHQRQRLPLIMVFHGYNEDAASVRKNSNMDRADAIVAYLEGVEKAWAPAPYAKTTGAQDLAFVDAVREQLAEEFSVDRARVFATGMSNGGGFAAYVGCQRPQDFTAVASVAAAFYQRVSEGCSAIPMKHIDFHGTEDRVIEYAGGHRHDTVYDSTAEMVEEGAQRNRCAPEPEVTQVTTGIVEERWLDCDAGMEHYRIEGGPHVWPGGAYDQSGTAPSGFATKRQLEFFGVGER